MSRLKLPLPSLTFTYSPHLLLLPPSECSVAAARVGRTTGCSDSAGAFEASPRQRGGTVGAAHGDEALVDWGRGVLVGAVWLAGVDPRGGLPCVAVGRR